MYLKVLPIHHVDKIDLINHNSLEGERVFCNSLKRLRSNVKYVEMKKRTKLTAFVGFQTLLQLTYLIILSFDIIANWIVSLSCFAQISAEMKRKTNAELSSFCGKRQVRVFRFQYSLLRGHQIRTYTTEFLRNGGFCLNFTL